LRVLTELVAAAHITKQYGTDEIVKALASDDELTTEDQLHTTTSCLLGARKIRVRRDFVRLKYGKAALSRN